MRVVSSTLHRLEVPAVVTNNLPTRSGHRVPQFLPYRQKCLLLFQQIDGIDVCLFCLYVHEFDQTCPEPNRGRIYLAYLDSVDYFRPRHLRTTVYHELILAYLKWSQARQCFSHCHIWVGQGRAGCCVLWCDVTEVTK